MAQWRFWCCRKWKLISHPLNTNPFPATFLNLKASVLLMEVTRDKSTYMVWTSDFDTDFEVGLLLGRRPW